MCIGETPKYIRVGRTPKLDTLNAHCTENHCTFSSSLTKYRSIVGVAFVRATRHAEVRTILRRRCADPSFGPSPTFFVLAGLQSSCSLSSAGPANHQRRPKTKETRRYFILHNSVFSIRARFWSNCRKFKSHPLICICLFTNRSAQAIGIRVPTLHMYSGTNAMCHC